MYSDLDESVHDLIESEQLNKFSVIERYCEVCQDLTPHKVDEESNECNNHVSIDIYCVVCKKNEDEDLGEF